MWWDIIKSSRREAYSVFLEEFGPEVDLRSLEVDNFLDDPENADVEYYLSVSNVSDEIMGHWVIQSNGSDIRFVSDKYSQYQAFVEGMFKEEYPKRYREILNIIGGNKDEPLQNDLLQLVTKYLEVSRSIMKQLRSSIIGVDMDDTLRTSVVLPVSHPGYVRMQSKMVIPKIDAAGPTKSDIIFAITELMVDRMMREIHIFRSQVTEGRVNALMGRGRPRLSNGFRDALTELYYEVLSTANSGGKNPHMVFNSAADNATRNLIDYLKVVAEVYLEE